MEEKQFSFGNAIAEIEKILKEMESGQYDIDTMSSKVKRASELINRCRKKLHETEQEIQSVFTEN